MKAVLAIDPGPVTSGWVLFDGERVLASRSAEVNERIIEWSPWGTCFKEFVKAGIYPSEVATAIEWISSYGMAVGKDVFETCYWVGRFDTGSAYRILRRDVKLHLCGSARAKDANVRQALVDRFGGVGGIKAAKGTKSAPGPLYGVSGHAWSALAVAVTWWDTMREES